MKKKVLICLILVLIAGLCACGQKRELTIEEKGDGILNIGVPIPSWSNMSAEKIAFSRELLDQKTAAINTYLLEHEKDYQVDLQYYGGIGYQKAAETYDIVIANQASEEKLTISKKQQLFMDIAPELSSDGKLSDLYESMPEAYWKTVMQNHAIFTPVRTTDSTITALTILVGGGLEEIGMTVPEELVGTPISHEWDGFFAKLYQSNSQIGFFSVAYAADDANMGRFQILVDPFLVLVESEKGLEAKCLYELEAMDDWMSLLANYHAVGYSYGFVDGKEEDYLNWTLDEEYLQNRVYMKTPTGFPNRIVVDPKYSLAYETEYYPLQNTIYNSVYELGNEVFISATSNEINLAYEFYNDMAVNTEFARLVCLDEDSEEGIQVVVNISPYATLLSANDEEFEANYAAKEAALLALEELPGRNFVFDEGPVKSQISKLTDTTGVVFMAKMELQKPENLPRWNTYRDNLVEAMYQNGLQDVIDEANRQLAEYLGE